MHKTKERVAAFATGRKEEGSLAERIAADPAAILADSIPVPFPAIPITTIIIPFPFQFTPAAEPVSAASDWLKAKYRILRPPSPPPPPQPLPVSNLNFIGPSLPKKAKHQGFHSAPSTSAA